MVAQTMFRHQGPRRTDRQNGVLAAYLAALAGYVNSASFVLLGTFTSHVTGNVGRFANDLTTRQLGAAAAAASLIAAFFAGSFIASMIIESNLAGRTAVAYGFALSFEGALLAGFILLAHVKIGPHPRFHDLQAAVLCMAMGAQNSLVTRLSGAVVRTTHLTGVVTDLGIEAARWFRFWRNELSERLGVKLAFGRSPVERPRLATLRLLATITTAFICGAVLGAAAGITLKITAFYLPCIAVVLIATQAFLSGTRPDSLPPQSTSVRER
jgi:uncharacterized membrane protein YoaK (UPF0700 family)